jgi:hypothetical protein
MLDRIRARLTFANVVSVLALFFALGGSAYATFVVNSNSDVAPNTISGHDPPSGDHANLIAGSVATQDLAAGSVTGGRLAASAVTNGKLATDAVTGPKVQSNSLTGSDINESTLSGIGTGILGGQWDNLMDSAGSVQRSPVGHTSAPSSVRWLAPVKLEITDFRAKLAAPPGAGKSRFLGIVAEDSQNNFVGHLTCTVTGATATTCHSTGSLTIPAGGLFDGEEGATGNVTASGVAWFGYRVVTP